MDDNMSSYCKLPEKGVLFLGGHQNMVKKLRQKFPRWTYISDDQMRRRCNINETIVFYWTNHGSHKLMRFTFSRLRRDSSIMYVRSTNLAKLIVEMQSIYTDSNVHENVGAIEI